MRLLRIDQNGEFSLTGDLSDEELSSYPYAILSHTWGKDDEEVSFADLTKGLGRTRVGYEKLRFCGEQAAKDGLDYFWVDTCCIDKSSSAELSKAITSMFHWYSGAVRCYVLLKDVSPRPSEDTDRLSRPWESDFRSSRWFRRGWTLQELLAPQSVEFFDMHGNRLGDKISLEQLIHEITKIPLPALHNAPLDEFGVDERMSWAKDRKTKHGEDKAYSLLGLFGVSMLPNYGEGIDRAFMRLQKEVQNEDFVARLPYALDAPFNSTKFQHDEGCLPNTRVDLLDKICKWADGEGEQQIFWLSGLAGTGKTTVARSVALLYDAKQQLGASFFFSRGGGDVGRAGTFVTSIAVQLARNVPGAHRHISNAVIQRPEIANQSLGDQWRHLVLEPLSKLEKPASFILIVDALDECEGSNDAQLIVRLLAICESPKPVRLRVLLTSRPEVHIQFGLNQVPDAKRQGFVLHQVSSPTINHDIRLFLEYKLDLIGQQDGEGPGWPGPKVIDGLVRSASGLFIWAATACRFISEGLFADERLHMLAGGGEGDDAASPEGHLNQLYLKVLQESVQSSYTAQELVKYYTMVRQILGGIIALSSPLSVLSLSKLIRIPEQRVNRILRWLHAILDIPEDQNQPLRLHHPSFRDFLFSMDRCIDKNFHVEEKQAHATLATSCIQLMSSTLKQDICGMKAPGTLSVDVEKGYVALSIKPEVQYACINWIQHFSKGNMQHGDCDMVLVFLKEHFLHWLEALGWLGKVPEGIHTISLLESAISTRDSQNLLAFVRDMKRFALYGRAAIEIAPLQVYYSTLVFAATNSIIKQQLVSQLPACIEVSPHVERDWSRLLQTLEGHTGWVQAATFSPDGKTVASLSGDATVRLWDAGTGTERHIFHGGGSAVSGVLFSQDSKTLASHHGYTVKVWDTEIGTQKYTLEHEGMVMAAAISLDDKTVASASSECEVKLWDLGTGTEQHTLRDEEAVYNAWFSPDSKTLALRPIRGPIVLWDTDTGTKRHSLHGHNRLANVLAFSPDSKIVATASEGTIKLWDTHTGIELQTLRRSVPRSDDSIHTIAFSSDGKIIASVSYKAIILWDVSTGTEQCTLRSHEEIYEAAISPDGTKVATKFHRGKVMFWDLVTGAFSPTFQIQYSHIDVFVFSPDSKVLMTAGWEKAIKLWDADTSNYPSEYALPGHTGSVKAIACSPDGKTVASASKDRTIKLWYIGNGTCAEQQTLRGHTDTIWTIAFSPDGKMMASGSSDRTVKLWDIGAGKGTEKHTLRGHESSMCSVAFSPDGNTVASASYDSKVKLWATSTGAELKTLRGHSAEVRSVAFSPDGRTLASASDDRSVKLWDMATGTERHSFKEEIGRRGVFYAVVFSPDGQTVAAACDNRAIGSRQTIKLWDAESGVEIHKFNIVGRIQSLTFSYDSSHIITDRGSYPTQIVRSEQCVAADPLNVVSIRKHWVFQGEERIIWLHPEHRTDCFATGRNVAVFGYRSGAVSALKLSDRVTPTL